MISYPVRTYTSEEDLPRTEQLAWKLAELAVDPVPVDDDVAAMIINRIIDNASVATASVARAPVAAARAQALDHPFTPGSSVFGVTDLVSPEWAAWANGVAVRELDYHDTYLAADYSHPADNIPALLAVAQHRGNTGAELIAGLATAYEIHVALVKSICLHEHKIDHIAHLAPAAAAGIGTMLGLDVETIFQAIGQALHTSTATRQSRKGQISTWKAYAPAFAAKIAVEAVDRAMRGQTSPEPIYEGEDGVIAWLLGGPEARYTVELPAPGSPKRGIMETYTKEHSAEYQSQALIDLARKLHGEHPELVDPANVESIVLHTSHHTHYVIGSGANDPQKYDPTATRETLDHSMPYILAVALQDGGWHHVDSYSPERAARPDTVELWHKITTVEDPEWTRRYHSPDPKEKAFGGRLEITRTDGTTVSAEIALADAHPLGARPFGRPEYLHKFHTLADGLATTEEIDRFLTAVQDLGNLVDTTGLNVVVAPGVLDGVNVAKGIF